MLRAVGTPKLCAKDSLLTKSPTISTSTLRCAPGASVTCPSCGCWRVCGCTAPRPGRARQARAARPRAAALRPRRRPRSRRARPVVGPRAQHRRRGIVSGVGGIPAIGVARKTAPNCRCLEVGRHIRPLLSNWMDCDCTCTSAICTLLYVTLLC